MKDRPDECIRQFSFYGRQIAESKPSCEATGSVPPFARSVWQDW
jgi:hypothetical protein